MTCEHVQEFLLRSDAADAPLMPAGMREHLASCPACATLRERLILLERAAQALPEAPGAEEARQRFIAQGLTGRARSASASGRRLWAWSWAAAALLLIGMGTALMMIRHKTTSENVIEQIVAFNVDLSQAAPAERGKLYAAKSTALKAKVNRASLPAEESKLASDLMETGQWMADHDDPMQEAERFCDTAQKLVDRIDAATGEGRPERLESLGRSYMMVVERGIDGSLKRVEARGFLNPDRKGQIAKLVQRDQAAARRLEMLLTRAPNAPLWRIRQVLEMAQMRRGARQGIK
jgi:hypothetical protein